MSDFDGAWKDTFDYFLQSFLAFFCPDIRAAVDWTHDPEALEQEFRPLAPEAVSGKVICDKLLRLRRVGTDDAAFLHIEAQNQRDDQLPWRVDRYNGRARDKYNHPVVSVVLLGDDDPDWTPGPYRFEQWGCRNELAFRSIKLLDWSNRESELLADENRVALVVLAHLKAIETRRALTERQNWRLQIVREIYRRDMEHEDRRRLLPVVEGILDLNEEREAEVRRIILQEQRENIVQRVSSFERMAKEEGREEGREEGLRAGIVTILELRFDSVEADLVALIEQADLAVLEKVLQASRTASLEDLRVLLTPQNGQA